jgi:hypothetical protein
MIGLCLAKAAAKVCLKEIDAAESVGALRIRGISDEITNKGIVFNSSFDVVAAYADLRSFEHEMIVRLLFAK